MLVNLVKDPEGRVVATFESARNGTVLRPMLLPGHTVHEVDAPNDYRSNIDDFYRRHSGS